jgi:hypothetical protein
MDYGYSNRNYLLPKGCKDLIDAIHMPRQIEHVITMQEGGIIFKFKVADLRRMDADVRFEQSCLRIIFNSPNGQASYGSFVQDRHETLIGVPSGYNLAKALTTYTEDEMRIFVPKC